MNHASFAIASALLALAGSAHADIIKVPGDYETIQAAIDAAHAGDGISVSSGLYKENLSISTNDLILKGRDVIIDGSYSGDCITVHADGVTLIGLELVNGGSPQTTDAPAHGGGITYVGDRALLLRCDVSGSSTYGINLVGHGEINHCTVTGSMGTGIVVDTKAQVGPQVLLTGNEVHGNAVGIQATDGPFLFNRNLVNGNVGDGIVLSILGGAGTDAAAAVGTEFSNNTTNGNGGTGLVVNDEVGLVRKIEGGETTLNALGIEIMATGTTVRNIDIEQNRKGGARFNVTHGSIEFSSIRGNGAFGVLVGAAVGATEGNSTVTSNNVALNGGDGIHIMSANNLVRHNAVKDNDGDGIQIATGALTNTLIENYLRDNRHDGLDNWGTGTIMIDNVIKNSVGADLAGLGDGNGSCDGTCSGNVVTDTSGEGTVQELELNTFSL